MRASRLLTILILLQTRGRMTAEALAREFEVSVRTIYRDVDELSASGVPVYAERGRAGGFALLDGYRTKLTGMTANEAEALAFAGLPGAAAQLGVGGALTAAKLKLLAALPKDQVAGAGKVAARFHFDPVGWYGRPEQTDLLPAIAGAVWAEKTLQITYESWRGVVERRVNPLGLVLKSGVWYLVAAVAGGMRTYRVSNIQDLTPTDEAFAWPAGFDLGAFWAAWLAEAEARIVRGVAVLKVTATGLARLANLGAQSVEMAQRTRSAPDAAGWMRVEVPIEGLDHATGEMVRLGAEAVVLEPKDLRERVAQVSRAMAGLYR
ncbi:MAG: transcriptional regulator [Caulobacter sp.]|nr:transcriptional regulator [Caulobacter sp.]